MTVHVIPTDPPTDARAWSQLTTLDGRVYLLEFEWSSRAAHWFISLSTSEGDPIATGVKVVADWPLFRLASWDDRAPPGAVVALDTSGESRDPGFADLGDRVVLVYYDEEELAA